MIPVKEIQLLQQLRGQAKQEVDAGISNFSMKKN